MSVKGASTNPEAEWEDSLQQCSRTPMEGENEDAEESLSSCKKAQSKEDKVCRVCGDKALGFNFNVITCESCKAFFRRNAFKKDVACLFENKCLIDVRTRRFCPACRIKKCFSMGMNPQMILDDREKKKRLNKVAENRVKKNLAADSSTNSSKSVTLLPHIKAEPTSDIELETHCSLNPQCDTGTSWDSKTQLSVRPKTPVGKAHGDTLEEIFKHPSSDLLPTDSDMFCQLLPEEKLSLNVISTAYGNTLGIIPENGPHSDLNEYQRAADLINNSEIAVRKLIAFVKYLDYFKVLSQTDQILMLKSCVMNSLLLRSSLFYNIEKDAWVTSNCVIPSSVLKSATGFEDLHDSHVYYCRRVKSMAKTDMTLYALLQVLIIFDPSAPNVSNRQYISSIQDRYLILLKHYFESQYSYTFAKEYYVSAIDRLCDLKALSEKHSQILMQVKPVEVEPLMLEVLNMK